MATIQENRKNGKLVSYKFTACVDQKNHRIFRCQRNYPLKIQIILLSAGELVLHRSEKSYKLLWNHVSK